MQFFINTKWDGRRNYECTQVVACQAEVAPGEAWTQIHEMELPAGVCQLYIEAGVRYFGWL